MKIIFFTILSLFIFEITHSQVTGIISSAAGQPVPFANVSLLKSNDSSFVKGVATNQKGTFSISYNVRGTYILQVTVRAIKAGAQQRLNWTAVKHSKILERWR